MTASAELSNTTQLLRRVRGGDDGARNQLVERYLPLLRRWAHGRLPRSARDLSETDDLVQITFLRALNNLGRFEAQRPGGFLAYLRTILLNALRDEIRRRQRRPQQLPIAEEQLASQTSVVEDLVGAEVLEAYEAALAKMDDEKRMAVVMRVEFGMSYDEIAHELERPSGNATRMMIARALKELAVTMPA